MTSGATPQTAGGFPPNKGVEMKKQKGFIETTAIVMVLAFIGIITSHEMKKNQTAEAESVQVAHQAK